MRLAHSLGMIVVAAAGACTSVAPPLPDRGSPNVNTQGQAQMRPTVPANRKENTSEHLPKIKLSPIDEALQVHSFKVFRATLLAAVKRHDSKFMLATLYPEIINGDDIEKGVDEFKRRWNLEQADSPLWDLLVSILSNGGSFNVDKGFKEFCAPYAVSEWRRVVDQLPSEADPLSYVAITGRDVEVRAKPNTNAAIISKLSYDVVRLDSNATVVDGFPPHVFAWVKITTPSGEEGYVSDKYVQGPMDHRACFRKIGGKWLMTELAARE